MILAAAAIDYIDHLKKNSKGWVFEPLVVTSDEPLKHDRFVAVLPRPNNCVSPYEFYVDNPPTGVSTLIKASKRGHYARLIEMRLDPNPTTKVLLRYWRINGWKQNEVSHKWSSFYGPNSPRVTPLQQSSVVDFRVYAIERMVKRRKKKAVIHRDAMDLSAIDSADTVSKVTMATLEKSLAKAHGGGRREKLKKYTDCLAVVMDGRNYHYEDYRFFGEIVYDG